MIEHLRNGVFLKSNIKRFIEFTNCNLSQRLVELTFISMMLKSMSYNKSQVFISIFVLLFSIISIISTRKGHFEAKKDTDLDYVKKIRIRT